MKMYWLLCSLLIIQVAGCHQSAPNKKPFFNSSRLRSLFFEIDPTRDTVLRTPQGARITIRAGSLTPVQKCIRLQIKEAYTMQDIIKGRLLTTSNGQPLSSGGMIYIVPADGNEVKIIRPITIAIPTPFTEPGMTLYKGETKDDELVNWEEAFPEKTDTLPVSPDTATYERLLAGQKLFHDNCWTCHRIDQPLTAPALIGISDRMKAIDPNYPALLYAFTRNNQAVLASGNRYFNDLYRSWNKTPMNVFPVLTNRELDAIYSYIENQQSNYHLPEPAPDTASKDCLDSCNKYVIQKEELLRQKEEFHANNEDVAARKKNIKDGTEPEAMIPELTNGDDIDANRYQFNVTAWGWQNVDMLTTDMVRTDTMDLSVNIPHARDNAIDIYLVVPSIRVYLPGARWEGKGNLYYFLDPAQKLSIPRGMQAFVIAMTETDQGMLFGKSTFTTGEISSIQLSLQPVSSEDINTSLGKNDMSDFQIRAVKANRAAEAKNLNKQIADADTLKPRNCDCDQIFSSSNNR